MARVDNLKNYLADVGKAIKDKKGDQTNIKASEFDTEISKIESIEDYISSTTIGRWIDFPSLISNYSFLSRIKKLPDFDLSDVNNSDVLKYFFANMANLKEIPKIKLNNELQELNLEYLLYHCVQITNIDNFIDAIKDKKIINASHILQNLTRIKDVSILSSFDFSNNVSLDSTFYHLEAINSLPLFDTSMVNNFNRAFSDCYKITSIPKYNTVRGEIFSHAFATTPDLISIPELDFSSAINVIGVLGNTHDNLTELGGFKDLGKSYIQKQTNYNNYKLDLSTAPNLTEESLMNVINNLYDLNQVYTEQLYSQQLVLGTTNLAKLSEEQIAIATNKGWTVS